MKNSYKNVITAKNGLVKQNRILMSALWHCRFDRTLSYSAKVSANKIPKFDKKSAWPMADYFCL